jgi:hypothetical protein
MVRDVSTLDGTARRDCAASTAAVICAVVVGAGAAAAVDEVELERAAGFVGVAGEDAAFELQAASSTAHVRPPIACKACLIRMKYPFVLVDGAITGDQQSLPRECRM